MTPKFLSVAFHTRFFPALLWHALRPQAREGTRFVSFHLETQLLLAVCLVLLALGLPGAVDHGTLLGWGLTAVGATGLLALLIHSLASRPSSPSYQDFLKGIFFFCLVAGPSLGLFLGALNHSLPLGLLLGTIGLGAGYLLGIGAGLGLQYLGWLGGLVSGLAGLAIFGLVVVDILLLSGALFG